MNILIIDWDETSAATLKSHIETLDHDVVHHTIKKKALDQLSAERFDMVFVDPHPDTDARQLILDIKRAMMGLPYIVLMESTDGEEGASAKNFLEQGANAFFEKQADKDKLEQILESGEYLIDTIQNLGDDSIDFPNAGGVIAKSAFNQLFLTSIERADRYGEFTYVLMIKVSNYADILEKDGPYYAELTMAKLSQHIVNIRRQSDIIGQIGKNEYALLLLRPRSEKESVGAAKRLAKELAQMPSPRQSVESDPEITLHLIKLPMAEKIVDHHCVLAAA